MSRVTAMSELISYRLSKTAANRIPIRAIVRGVPIYIGGEQEGASGILDTGFLSNIPDAIKQTGADVETLRNEIFTAANFGAGTQNKEAVEFYVDVMIPFLKDWNSFASDHTHGWDKFADNFIIFGGLSSWNSINQYRRRLVDIRTAAEKIIDFKSPAPQGPSVNLVQQAANQATKAVQAIWSVLKWVIITITIAGAILAVIYIGGAM